MTRDEAIEGVRHIWTGASPAVIEAFVKLGMLKLDEPKEHPSDLATRVLDNLPFGSTPYQIMTALHKAGLRIVEK